MGTLDGEVMGAEPRTVPQLLQAGIAAAKAGQRDHARDLLTRVTELDADNINAWLWLSGVIDNPLEQETCLERVVKIDPDHAAAQKGLAVVRKRVVEALFNDVSAAVSARDNARVRGLLTQIVTRDENNLNAWIWLSRVVDSPEEQEVCYENILTLDPDNVEAAEKLATIQRLREEANVNIYAAPEEETPEKFERAAPTLAAAVLGDEYREKFTSPEPEPEPEVTSVAPQLWAKYEDELACPYCAAPTEHDDRRCKSCGNRLWIKTRRRDKPSTIFWILFAIEVFSTVISAIGPFIVLYLVGISIGFNDPSKLLGVYFGNPGDVPPGIAAQALAIMPRIVFFLTWLPVLISAAYTVLLYLRWPPIFYLLMGSAGLSLIGSIVGLGFYATQGLLAIIPGVIGLLISIGTFVMILQLEKDFKRDKWRILLKVDSGIKDGIAFLIRGRQYADQKMWARAAVHFRRAAALLPYQVDGYIATAMACIRLKDYKLAGHVLKDAQALEPENQQITGLIALINEQKGISTASPAGQNS